MKTEKGLESMVFDYCKKCGERKQLRGGLCEDCQSEKEAERMDSILGTREKKSREEVEKEIAERKKDKRFWWGNKSE